MEKEHGILIGMVPEIVLPGSLLQGADEIEEKLLDLIEEMVRSRASYEDEVTTGKGNILQETFSAFSPAIVGFAGLADGINPCAFTTLIFFISFLTLYAYSKRKILIAGTSFIVAIFLTYLSLGVGGAAFLGRMESFGLLSNLVKYSIALFAAVLGAFALYDFILYKRTKSSEGLKLQLPGFIKNIIHKHIGSTYREEKRFSSSILKLGAVTFISGIFIAALESVCTGQIYLPTITFVMNVPNLRLHAFLYLVLYNLTFILPLVIVFLLAYKGVASERFTHFTKKHLSTLKILYVVLFFVLAILLLIL